jgi:hypothetical protein
MGHPGKSNRRSPFDFDRSRDLRSGKLSAPLKSASLGMTVLWWRGHFRYPRSQTRDLGHPLLVRVRKVRAPWRLPSGAKAHENLTAFLPGINPRPTSRALVTKQRMFAESRARPFRPLSPNFVAKKIDGTIRWGHPRDPLRFKRGLERTGRLPRARESTSPSLLKQMN